MLLNYDGLTRWTCTECYRSLAIRIDTYSNNIYIYGYTLGRQLDLSVRLSDVWFPHCILSVYSTFRDAELWINSNLETDETPYGTRYIVVWCVHILVVQCYQSIDGSVQPSFRHIIDRIGSNYWKRAHTLFIGPTYNSTNLVAWMSSYGRFEISRAIYS